MRLEWTDPAVEHLAGIRAYIACDSETCAADFVARIVRVAEQLIPFPRLGRSVPEAFDPEVRELIFRSYRILYRVREERVQVLAILHGARDLGRMFPKPWDVS